MTLKILNAHVHTAPSSQNVLDIFEGEWASQLPRQYKLTTRPGTARLLEDSRIIWAEKTLGSFADWKVLELGPLEGGHAYMLQKRNARSVTSVESNTRAFLKCLAIKEVLGLDRVQFKLGDFMAFLRQEQRSFDLVVASGVLYHMQEPVELLKLISKVTRRVFLWTHYYDESIFSQSRIRSRKFGALQSFEYEGVCYEYAKQTYGKLLDRPGFCGGSRATSRWLSRPSIMRALAHYGFADIEINFDKPDHPNGPAFAICAKK